MPTFTEELLGASKHGATLEGNPFHTWLHRTQSYLKTCTGITQQNLNKLSAWNGYTLHIQIDIQEKKFARYLHKSSPTSR